MFEINIHSLDVIDIQKNILNVECNLFLRTDAFPRIYCYIFVNKIIQAKKFPRNYAILEW